MNTLQVLHLVFIALWGGVLACEAILELLPLHNTADRKIVADLHFRIDMLVEAPLLAAILVTGALLLSQASWSLLLAVKVAGGLAVIGANAYCIVVVVQRHLAMRRAAKEEAKASFAAHTRSIYRVSVIALPVGLGVFALGLALL